MLAKIIINHDPCYEIYVCSYNNYIREEKMIRRFNETHVSANIYSYKENDPRVQLLNDGGLNENNRRTYGNFFSMISEMEDFCNNSTKEFGVFFENDIFLKKTLLVDLPHACEQLKILNLDVLLIGILLDVSPEEYGCNLIHIDKYNNKYYDFQDNLYGAHVFILTKK